MATFKNRNELCSKNYDMNKPEDAVRVAELRAVFNHKDKKNFGLQGLRDILAKLRGEPLGQQRLSRAKTQEDLIAMILCYERQNSDRYVQEPVVLQKRRITRKSNPDITRPLPLPLPIQSGVFLPTSKTLSNKLIKIRKTVRFRPTSISNTNYLDPMLSSKIAQIDYPPIEPIYYPPIAQIDYPPIEPIDSPPIYYPPIEPINSQQIDSPPIEQINTVSNSLVPTGVMKHGLEVPDPLEYNFDDNIGNLESNTNGYLRNKELAEHNALKTASESSNPDTEFSFLYPDINDPDFNRKIAVIKEFNDTQYDGEIRPVKEYANKMCDVEFELTPHQLFVKNFLSFQTPYNSLLLYHGLGSGKTCSAIGVAEEMRKYMKQVGIKQKIFVVASPNVQQNFRLQLFDDKKLVQNNGVWNIQSCIGNTLLKEINPTNIKGLSKERIVKQINGIIDMHYEFMGYIELSNFIAKEISVSSTSGLSEKDSLKMKVRNIKRIFNNRLIIIDEVHNIRISDENKHKTVAMRLFEVAKYAENMRLLLLSATPMYNSYKEIIWITNLLNMVDKRSQITLGDVFDKSGEFVESIELPNGQMTENGRDLLRRKMTGYVSYIRGENPYTFPYRIYPSYFVKERTFSKNNAATATATATEATEATESSQLIYPIFQLNQRIIDDPLKYVDVFVSPIGSYQEKGYMFIIENMRKSVEKENPLGNVDVLPAFENMDKFGYTMLQTPLEALNIVYPNQYLDNTVTATKLPIVGKAGLDSVMTSISKVINGLPQRYNFQYRPEIIQRYGQIFSQEHIAKYSSKIAEITRIIRNSTGIVMIYSQYIDGGIVPLGLALEEMGFSRYGTTPGTKSLFSSPPVELLDALTMRSKTEVPADRFRKAQYMMITGDGAFSPNNLDDLKYATDPKNKDGERVKVILISRAAAEGLDFKCIRQIHIMEPWYNMNRIEQIIGRAVRNLSHCYLPFEMRNVEIYMHATVLREHVEEECADLYVYRLAEKKAIQIGRVSRLIKETAVDCILNIKQSSLTADRLAELAENQHIQLTLSTGNKPIEYRIGDNPRTDACDYMDTCEFKCYSNGKNDIPTITDLQKSTYSMDFANMNNERIMTRIRQLFRDRSYYKREELINSINIVKTYPLEQIYYTLSYMIKTPNEIILDKYNRLGSLTNKDEYYLFQPLEITDENASIYERTVPVDYKQTALSVELPPSIRYIESAAAAAAATDTESTTTDISKTLSDIYNRHIAEIEREIDVATTVLKYKEPQGQWTWYMHASRVFLNLERDYHIPRPLIIKYIIYHYLHSLSIDDKMSLVRYIFSGLDEPTEPVKQSVKEYFDERVLNVAKPISRRGILLTTNDNKRQLYVQDPKDNLLWNENQPEDYKLFKDSLSIFVVSTANIKGPIVGYYSHLPKYGMVFKIKYMNIKNSKGEKCDRAGKAKMIEMMNLFDRTDENPAPYNKKNTEDIAATGLCVILEIRMQNKTRTNPQTVWFLTAEQSVFIDLPGMNR